MANELQQTNPALENWLRIATCNLSTDPAERVRSELRAHFESAKENAIAGGLSEAEATCKVLRDIGDAKAINRAYRRVHLTVPEARLLRAAKCEGAWIGRAFSSSRRRWTMRLATMVPGAVLCAIAYSQADVLLFTLGIGIGLVFGLPLWMRSRTPARGRAYRALRWTWLLAVLWFSYGSEEGAFSGLYFASMALSFGATIGWMEWMSMSLRRKIPSDKWPIPLYY